MRKQWITHLTQPLRVVIVGLGTQIQLQVTEHVAEDEPEEHQAAQRHDRLLADL